MRERVRDGLVMALLAAGLFAAEEPTTTTAPCMEPGQVIQPLTAIPQCPATTTTVTEEEETTTSTTVAP